MNKKRLFVIIVIVGLFLSCYTVMQNTKYDRLARYPFGSDQERTIIENVLNDQEIEYIVEYAIEPDFFMQYINYEKFNIYHVEQYNHFNSLFPYFSLEDTVSIVEKLNLLNKANDNYYNKIKNFDTEHIMNILRSYI